jgi:tRNA modification GTPase
MVSDQDTIVAIATPPGRGGVGVVRVSGSLVVTIAEALIGKLPTPRVATYAEFRDQAGLVIDLGLALYFVKPHSFTGESILECQCHGSPIVLDNLLKRIIQLGARLARPGEFSERAFLNNKIDLTQAEAIADLINSSTTQAARSALQTLQGEFSRLIHGLTDDLIYLRMYVEAALDFPEEEIDFISDAIVQQKLQSLLAQFASIQQNAKQGVLLNEGIKVVIAGKPNAGKSSLLNALTGYDAAIVTNTPGTTRDVIKEKIQLDGIPLHLIDTAGLRNSTDSIEQEGIRRARDMLKQADCILYVIDSSQQISSINEEIAQEFANWEEDIQTRLLILFNKIDLLEIEPIVKQDQQLVVIPLSTKTGKGMDRLKAELKKLLGYQEFSENGFIARRRHLTALAQALEHVKTGQACLLANKSVELMAEELRLAQLCLNEITGDFTSEDLLTEIFSSFCIGK